MTQLTAVAPAHPLTVAEFLSLGERVGFDALRHAELQEGAIVMAASATPRHMRAALHLAMALGAQQPGGFEVLPEVDIDLRLQPADRPGTVRNPDVTVVPVSAYERVGRDGGVLHAGEVKLVVEILSPSNRRTDLVVKRAEYADAGIAHYWVLDVVGRPALTAFDLTPTGGHAEPGPVTGTLTAEQPFPVVLDLDALV